MDALAFWQGKRVLVTGHTGFKGSWLTLVLQYLDAEVIGLALAPPSTPNLFSLAGVDRNLNHHLIDIGDFLSVKALIEATRPEIVLHLAAQALVRRSYLQPLTTYGVNVMGTVHLLEAVRAVGCVRAVVNVTSDKCYAVGAVPQRFSESHRLGGHDPYSSSKACAELVTQAYRDSYFMNSNTGIATARAGNVLGGGDFAAERLMPDIQAACAQGQMVALRHPEAVRPWQYVLDPLWGYLLLAQKLYEQPQAFSGAWNFGPTEPEAHSVIALATEVAALWGLSPGWVPQRTEDFPETQILNLDSTKALRELSWQTQTSLAQTLQAATVWYQTFYQDPTLVQAFSLKQVKSFFKEKLKARVSQSIGESA